MKIIDLLRDFLHKQQGKGCFPYNAWLHGDEMEVYVRKSVPRYLGNNKHVTLDIANVQVYEKGTGKFTKFLAEAEALNPWGGIYIECVHETRLFGFLLRNGYTQQKDCVPASFYKIKE